MAWRVRRGPRSPFIAPGSPWESGDHERLNRTLPDERLRGEFPCSLAEAEVLIERWRREYDQP